MGNRIVKTVDPSTQMVLLNVPQNQVTVGEEINATVDSSDEVTATVDASDTVVAVVDECP